MIPALIVKFHTAKIQEQKSVKLWGTGNPVREFIYVDDLAESCLFLMQSYNSSEIINVGLGEEISIKNLAYLIKDIIGIMEKLPLIHPSPMAHLERHLMDQN